MESNFSDYLKSLRLSTNTQKSYVSDIKQFLLWNEEKRGKILVIAIQDYIHFLENNLTPASINRKITSLNRYLRFQGENVVMPFLKVEKQDFFDDFLTNKDVKKMITKAQINEDYRAVALIATLYYTGGRISEILQLKTSEIKKNSVIVKGKGDKYRELLLGKKLQKYLRDYIEEKDKKAIYIFTGRKNPENSITRNTAHTILKHYCSSIKNIEMEMVHAHAFRHLFAQNLARKNVNPVVIAQLLGHSLTVTGLYIKNSKKELLKIIDSLNL